MQGPANRAQRTKYIHTMVTVPSPPCAPLVCLQTAATGSRGTTLGSGFTLTPTGTTLPSVSKTREAYSSYSRPPPSLSLPTPRACALGPGAIFRARSSHLAPPVTSCATHCAAELQPSAGLSPNTRMRCFALAVPRPTPLSNSPSISAPSLPRSLAPSASCRPADQPAWPTNQSDGPERGLSVQHVGQARAEG